jgi:hypothetical protein
MPGASGDSCEFAAASLEGELVFRIVFPRPRTYRVWAEFQRNGVVNVVHFDVVVGEPVIGWETLRNELGPGSVSAA